MPTLPGLPAPTRTSPATLGGQEGRAAGADCSGESTIADTDSDTYRDEDGADGSGLPLGRSVSAMRRQLEEKAGAKQDDTPRVAEEMLAELDRVKRELEQLRETKLKYEELRRNHEKLQVENDEVRKIVGDMYVSVDEDRELRELYEKTYTDIIDSLNSTQPRTADLMPKLYDLMVRMNDEDIRKEYIVQMEIILNDDPHVSERVKGIAEGMSIKLGEMMDQPRHQRIAKLAKEEEERKKGNEIAAQSKREVQARKERDERQKELNKQAFEALVPVFRRVEGVKLISLQGDQRRLAQRISNRLELRMLLFDLYTLKKIGPGQYKSMGTGGLKNEEIRALMHKLSSEADLLNTSVDASRLHSMLERKIETLPMQIKEAEWQASSTPQVAGSLSHRTEMNILTTSAGVRRPPPPPPGGPQRPPPPPSGGPPPPPPPPPLQPPTRGLPSPLLPATLESSPPVPLQHLPPGSGDGIGPSQLSRRDELMSQIAAGAGRLKKTQGPRQKRAGLGGKVVDSTGSGISTSSPPPLGDGGGRVSSGRPVRGRTAVGAHIHANEDP